MYVTRNRQIFAELASYIAGNGTFHCLALLIELKQFSLKAYECIIFSFLSPTMQRLTGYWLLIGR